MSRLDAARAALAELRGTRRKLLQRIVDLDLEARRESDPQRKIELRGRITELRTEVDGLRERELEGPARELDPTAMVGALASHLPILLAPLRVQTRFADGVEGRELRIRVYPDDFSVQTLDPQLGDAERIAGDAYWAAPEVRPDEATISRIEAWRGLVAQLGAPRATFVRRATDPAAPRPLDAGPRHAALWTLPERLVFRCLGPGGALLGQPFVGRPIPDGLEAGFDPTRPDGGITRPAGDRGEFDPPLELAWQSDFDAAVQVGMAVRIPLSTLGDPRRIERIVVLGVRLSDDEATSAALLGRLIDDHQHTEGFAFVPQGTPSNVTHEGEARAELDADALDAVLGDRGAFDDDPNKTLYSDECDGLRLARALGLDPEALRHVPFAGTRDGAEAIAMKRALWAGTLGYTMQQMLSPLFEDGAFVRINTHIGERMMLAARFFFTNFVSGRGPLPAVRVGRQPYGILPVCADMLGPLAPGLPAWREDFIDAFNAALHAKLQILAPVWQTLARERVPTLARGQLAEVLALQASSAEYHVSRLLGAEYLANWVDFKDAATGKAEMAKLVELLRQRWAAFNALCPGLIAGTPFLSSLTFAGGLWRRILTDVTRFDRALSTPLPGDVVDDLPLSETRSIADAYPNYIRALATLPFADVRRGLQRTGADGKPQPVTALLYQMLRHSYLYEHVFAAMRLLHHANGVPWSAFREKELVNLGFQFDPTYWDLLEKRGTLQVFDFSLSALELLQRRDELRDFLPRSREQLGDIDELHRALQRLSDLPTARLERLFAEHVDLCGHRLDAWITGFAYQRLLGQRVARDPQQQHPLRDPHVEGTPLRFDLDLRPLMPSRGLYLGAYGIVEGLEPDPVGVVVDDLPAELVPKNGRPVKRDPDNVGLIHAPSLNHAVTASILRSAAVAEPGSEAFNIDLSSARTRDALWMIDGIRNGQLPAALLGYRFERGLREAGAALQQHLPALRGAFPMPRPPDTKPDDASESIPPRDVVNGMAIVQALRDGRLDAALAAVNPGLDATALQAARRLAGEVAALLDACSDLMLAESVHQAALGNFARAGGVVGAAGEFTHVPDRFDVVRTPRTGTLVTQRVLLAFDPVVNAPRTTPRARLAPALDAWVAAMLGPLDRLVVSIDYLGDAESPAAATVTLQEPPRPSGTPAFAPLASFQLTLDQFGLAPLDLVHLLDDEHGTELARRADLLARPAFEADRADASFTRIELRCFGAAPPDHRPVGDVMPLAAQLRRLLTHARSATRRDLLAPKELHDVAGSRAELDALDGAALQLAVLGSFDGGDEADPDSLLLGAETAAAALGGAAAADEAGVVALLLRASAYGLPDAVPVLVGAPGPERLGALRVQAGRAQAALQARVDAARGQTTAALLASDLLSACNEAVKTLLGSALPLAPPLGATEDLAPAALDDAAAPSERVEDWLFAASVVREGAGRLQHARTLAAAADSPMAPLRVLQWPAGTTPWLADERPAGASWDDDRVSIVLQPAASLDLTQPLVGLVIDEWTELLPRQTETTGVAFHYDAPNSEPPQALLLAVSTRALNQHGQWSWDELVQCVEKTFDLARLRLVGPDELRHTALDVLLPATAMAESAAPVTVSTSLLVQAADELAAQQHAVWLRL